MFDHRPSGRDRTADRTLTPMHQRHAAGSDGSGRSGRPGIDRVPVAGSGGLREAAPGVSRRSFLRTSGGAAGVAAAFGAFLPSVAAGSADERDVLFTGNRRDGTVSLHDASTYEPLGTVDALPDGETDPDPKEDPGQRVAYPVVNESAGGENYVQDLDVSPDGRTVYVSRGHLADVVAIDVGTNELVWETELDGYRADHQVLAPDGRYLYTSDVTADAVHRIATADGEIADSAEVTTFPHGNHLHDLPGYGGDRTLVNGSLGNMLAPDRADMDHRLTFLDPGTMSVERVHDFEEGVRPFAFTPGGSTAYVQISYLHGFHEYDVAADRVTRTKRLPETEHVPESEDDYPLQSAHHGIDVSGDGEYVCVAGTTSWYAAVVRRSDLELLDYFEVGKHPYWVQTAPGGERAFVAVKGEDVVSVVDYADATEVARISVGDDPMVMEHRPVPESVL